jgi:molybdenum cofactor cytidylyltransferase
MLGSDKLLADVDGIPMLRHAANIASQSDADLTHIVMQPNRPERVAALGETNANIVLNPGWPEGMAASIRAGMAAISENCDAVIIALADMPDITVDHFNRLMAGYAPNDGREICRAIDENGVAGLPVLFGARFFESLSELKGDRGAKEILQESKVFVTDVPTSGLGATTDLDTPQNWENWRKNR